MKRIVGITLLGLVYAPLHRLLDPSVTGPAGAATRDAAEAAWGVGLYGTILVLGLAYLVSRISTAELPRALGKSIVSSLEAPASLTFAALVGTVAFALCATVALLLFDRQPTSVDAMAELLHAAALRSGHLTLALPGDPAAWAIQDGVVLGDGWASIYPPLHILLLAAGGSVGAPWLVGPFAVGVATAVSALCFERLLGTSVGRAAGVLLAVSPFWILLGATHLSHATAAACLALVLWCGLRAAEGGPGWSVGAGAALGASVCARPWVGLVVGATLLLGTWLPVYLADPSGRRRWAARAAAVGAGGVPFAALLLGWNAALWGSPFRLGYSVAFGPAHGLGFHVDPWGNRYGVLEAIAYTGADIVQLGEHLLESPMPVVAVIGAALVFTRVRSATGPLGWWVFAAVVANAFYWHHGIHMGPRMLYESTPAWIGLFVATTAALADMDGDTRGVGVWSVSLMLAGAAILTPGSIRGRAQSALTTSATLPAPPAPGSLVFVHGSWASRIAARLVATEMRHDSIETALRRNDVCAVDRYARWRRAPEGVEPPDLDFEPLPGSPPELVTRLLSPGNPVRVDAGRERDGACVREALSDRFGIMELEPLLWQAPPRLDDDLLIARDLGPTANAALRAAHDGPAFVLVAGTDEGPPRLLDYDDGIELLWRGAAAAIR